MSSSSSKMFGLRMGLEKAMATSLRRTWTTATVCITLSVLLRILNIIEVDITENSKQVDLHVIVCWVHWL